MANSLSSVFYFYNWVIKCKWRLIYCHSLKLNMVFFISICTQCHHTRLSLKCFYFYIYFMIFLSFEAFTALTHIQSNIGPSLFYWILFYHPLDWILSPSHSDFVNTLHSTFITIHYVARASAHTHTRTFYDVSIWQCF